MEQRTAERSCSATNSINPTGPTLDVDCVHSSGSMSPHYIRWREKTVGRRTIKRAPARQEVDGKGFRLADEVRHIQGKAADHHGRMVILGQLILFSTDTGDAWLLD